MSVRSMTPITEPHASLSSTPDADAATPSHRRLSFLDAVRGVAAVAVLVQHLGSQQIRGFEPATRSFFNIGQFGVVAFCLVSGFIIPVSMEKYGKLAPFWKARFFRLYPMYWVSLIAMLVIGYTGFAKLGRPFYIHPLLAIAANITMLQRFLMMPDADGVYWTLALELIFYVLCSLLLWRGWLKRPVLIALLAAGSVAATNNILAFVLHRSPPAMHFSLVLSAFVGAVAYRVYRGELALKFLNLLVPIVFTVVIQGFWLHYVRKPELHKLPIALGAILAAWVAGYALFFLFFACRQIHFPRWMQWLGQISYSLYVLHLLVLDFVPVNHPLFWIPVATAICLGLSHLTYRYVERPAMRLGR
jgi:peptidoglycan/LPS O-acetylase OafA/YrhL